MPLSRQSLWVLSEIRKINTNTQECIFLRNNNSRLHTMNVRNFMTKMPTTLHGFRSSFRNWCLRAGVSDAVAEISLMHQYGENATVRSYLRDDLMDLRRDAMQRWADFVLPMNVLTGEFLSEEQQAKLNAVKHRTVGKGFDGLWNDTWGLNLRETPVADINPDDPSKKTE